MGGLLNPCTFHTIYDAAGKTIAEYSTIQADTPKINYTTNDHLGSPRINTDAVGKVIARHDTMPFGEEIQRVNYGSDNLRNRFTTYERDGETELDFAQARYYNKNLGRFYSVDPENVGASEDDPQSWNAYAYARNNPTVLGDPSGENYIYCNLQGACVNYSDKEFQGYLKSLPEGFDRVKNENGDGGGVIRQNGEVVARYTRPEVDFDSPLAQGVMNEMHRRAPALQKLNKIGAVISGGVIAAPVLADAILATLGRYAITKGMESAIEEAAVNPKIYAQLEKQFAKDGAKSIYKALRGAEKALEEHVAKVKDLPYKSQVEGTIRNTASQIKTIIKFINDHYLP